MRYLGKEGFLNPQVGYADDDQTSDSSDSSFLRRLGEAAADSSDSESDDVEIDLDVSAEDSEDELSGSDNESSLDDLIGSAIGLTPALEEPEERDGSPNVHISDGSGDDSISIDDFVGGLGDL